MGVYPGVRGRARAVAGVDAVRWAVAGQQVGGLAALRRVLPCCCWVVGGVAGMGGVMNRNDKAGAPLLPVADAGWWDVWPR